MIMKIIIAEAGSASNIGSMALVENAIRIARVVSPDCQICILSSDPESIKKELYQSGLKDSQIDVSHDFFKFPQGNFIYKLIWLIRTVLEILFFRFCLFFTRKPYKWLKGRKMAILREISESDYVFCIGAERINDVYFKTAYLSLEALSIYQKIGAKLIHFSLTIGPVFYKSTIKKASAVLEKSYAIFVRDTKSYELLDKMHVHSPHVYNSYDIAILQKPLEDNSELLVRLNIPKVPYICVSVISWAFKNVKGPMRQKDYNESVAKTLDYIVEKYGLKIVFTPTVVNAGYADDVASSREIVGLMKHKGSAIVISELLMPSELSAVFSEAQFSIVTRMHAAILCTGAGACPIIAINYLYKLREYMKNIGFEDYSIDIDYVTSDALILFTEKMISNYASNLHALHSRLDYMRKTLLNNINDIIQKDIDRRQ